MVRQKAFRNDQIITEIHPGTSFMLGIQYNSSSKIRKTFLTNLEELSLHIKDKGKYKAYKKLCIDFGINLDKMPIKYPRLILAEQPGYLFYGEVLIRHRLLKILLEKGDFHPNSGVYSLAEDLGSFYGEKSPLMQFTFHPYWKSNRLISVRDQKRYRSRAYATLPVKGDIFTRISTAFRLYDRVLDAVMVSPKAFVKEVFNIRDNAGKSKFVHTLLPADCSKKSLIELASMLEKYDLEKAKSFFQIGYKKLSNNCSWSTYWDGVNEEFLGESIRSLGALLNQFLLAIEDPVKMSLQLMKAIAHPIDKPICITGFITAEKKYRLVYFDPKNNNFFFYHTPKEKKTISWEEVRQLAIKNRTGGPSGTIEYLLMAVSGIYMIVDSCDGFYAYDTAARKIHQQYTGIKFPSINLLESRYFPYYMDVFNPGFEPWIRRSIHSFFNP